MAGYFSNEEMTMKRLTNLALASFGLLVLPVSVALAGTVTPPVSVVPEPATIALLATGLAVVGGIAARRRNRK